MQETPYDWNFFCLGETLHFVASEVKKSMKGTQAFRRAIKIAMLTFSIESAGKRCWGYLTVSWENHNFFLLYFYQNAYSLLEFFFYRIISKWNVEELTLYLAQTINVSQLGL